MLCCIFLFFSFTIGQVAMAIPLPLAPCGSNTPFYVGSGRPNRFIYIYTRYMGVHRRENCFLVKGYSTLTTHVRRSIIASLLRDLIFYIRLSMSVLCAVCVSDVVVAVVVRCSLCIVNSVSMLICVAAQSKEPWPDWEGVHSFKKKKLKIK